MIVQFPLSGRLKEQAETQHRSLAFVEQEINAAQNQLTQSNSILQDTRFLVEKLAASAFHLQRSRGIFARQLSSSKEILTEHLKRKLKRMHERH